MHRTAVALIGSGGLHVDLGRHLFDISSLSKSVGVAAVGACHPVRIWAFVIQGHHTTHRHRFLPASEVAIGPIPAFGELISKGWRPRST
ncbi:MAG TPA: hypothetical protein EYN31_07365 [Candidatus Marinimicrobia bacterium]|nr:hypothetical protein [Candidatus Neomarinimicrobiota bacterium]